MWWDATKGDLRIPGSLPDFLANNAARLQLASLSWSERKRSIGSLWVAGEREVEGAAFSLVVGEPDVSSVGFDNGFGDVEAEADT